MNFIDDIILIHDNWDIVQHLTVAVETETQDAIFV